MGTLFSDQRYRDHNTQQLFVLPMLLGYNDMESQAYVALPTSTQLLCIRNDITRRTRESCGVRCGKSD